MSFLDETGLAHFWDKVKAALSDKMDTFEVGSSLELSADDGDAGGRLDVKHPVVPITKAEYDALTTEQKNSETFWAITDDAGSGSPLEVYSTEETQIGTWIDGKPLYRRVFITTTPSVTMSDVQVFTIPDASGVVDMRGFLVNADGTRVPLFLNAISGNSFFIGLSKGNTVKLMVGHANYTNRPATIIVEYTKTTDQGVTG